MAAPAKFLFDVDFAAGSQREPTITLSETAYDPSSDEEAGSARSASLRRERQLAAARARQSRAAPAR